MTAATARSHPIVTILFESLVTEDTTTRHWYHVPREGDHIDLEADIEDRDGKPVDRPIIGSVKVVMWGDADEGEPDVVVRVR